MQRKIKDVKLLLQDDRGSILPLVAVVLILIIFLGAYEIGNIFVYRDRAVVRDAIDSAVTSALAAGTTVKSQDTNYYEQLDPIWGSGPLGPIIIGWQWNPYENNSKNYIYLDRNTAENTAKANFDKILQKTKINASLISWNFSVTYDDERYLNVTQNRGHTPIAPSWWQSSFGDSQPPPWSSPISYEQKQVRFPRWVKVSIKATVNIPVPMGGMFGKTTQSFSWGTDGIKELTPDKVMN